MVSSSPLLKNDARSTARPASDSLISAAASFVPSIGASTAPSWPAYLRRSYSDRLIASALTFAHSSTPSVASPKVCVTTFSSSSTELAASSQPLNMSYAW
jgi:hypothetical protein